MLEFLAAIAVAPWTHPLAFRPLPGWRTGASGTVKSRYDDSDLAAPKESAAWIALNVRYRDPATADPPNKTLAHLPRSGVVVWAVIYQGRPRGQTPIQLDLRKARHLPCCEGEGVTGGVSELTGAGPHGAYSVIVRVYFGLPPTRALRATAQRALDRLALPPVLVKPRLPVVSFTRLAPGWHTYGGVGGAYATSWRYRPGEKGWATAMPRNSIVVNVFFPHTKRRHPRLRLVMPPKPTTFLEGTNDTPEYRIHGQVAGRWVEVWVDIRRRHPTRSQLRVAQQVVAGIRVR